MLDVVLSVLSHVGNVVLGVLPFALGLAVAFTILGALAEKCNPGEPWWRKPDLATDFLFMFTLPLFTGWARVGFMIVGATLLYGVSGDELVRFFEGGYGPLAGLPYAAQVAVYLVGADLMMYWTHRAFHTMTLWRYHAIHHAPEHLDWTSASRFHPVNIVFHSVLADAVLLTLGIAPQVLVALAPINVAVSAFVHANLDWTLGPFRYVIAGPVFHRWHHTDYRRGGNKNFAPTFPVIDLVFGTFYMPEGELPDRYGVHDKHFPKDFARQLLYPFKRRAPRAGQPAG
jgi:sterol desaturase/sphingolipid hydroxylase (fatty acid hydroxylase superfamily)